MTLDAGIESRIRSLIPDTDAIFGEDGDQYLFTSEDIENFYLDGFSSTKYAAGLAKIVVGSSEALILKVIKNYETGTDGAALAKQWLAMGKQLITLASTELGLAALDYFDVIDSNADETRYEGTVGGYPYFRTGIPVASRGYYDYSDGGSQWG